MAAQDASKTKQDFEKAIARLRQLRDEIKVQAHLASMDAKDAWKKLEPSLAELEQKMGQVTDASRAKAQELLKRFAELRDRLKQPKPK